MPLGHGWKTLLVRKLDIISVGYYNNWIKKGWVSATGDGVKNKELIQEIY